MNDQSRWAYENRQRREAFLQRMDTFNDELRTRLEAQRQARQAGDSSTDPRAGEGSHGEKPYSGSSP